MTPDELDAYYQNLLILQYKTLPKAAATVGALCAQVIAGLIYTQVQGAFDVETAAGAQLDTLGRYVGAYRAIVGFAPSVDYYELPYYADGAPGFFGFADYGDVADPSTFWKLYNTADSAFVLSDGLLRQMIQYLIELHASDQSVASTDAICLEFFGTYVTWVDNGDMTVTFTHSASTDPNIFFELVKFLGLLPRSAGVQVIVVET